ncbi:hypothetical protein AAFF_G00351740 [Aldrovandia affinis]|uniref:Uncharacterized protein n=1 Tax=Aldrovandia affinis TaxID=143900 RepID=A0AAD7SJT4_9TELE|nr:hypothetical protein AAFF_G00351740 [Aldrovandia affinis]
MAAGDVGFFLSPERFVHRGSRVTREEAIAVPETTGGGRGSAAAVIQREPRWSTVREGGGGDCSSRFPGERGEKILVRRRGASHRAHASTALLQKGTLRMGFQIESGKKVTAGPYTEEEPAVKSSSSPFQ